ncbi:MAG: hypothetical protein COB67_09700 [SAR324 cluster bacterium]|uniref:Uncharacterized protein n=1 Tax=SAR324 cluster bacterium TaxID=2024889 RepID=A0A2A4T080_9DELT|nr:MAG: hypothetical protein COB67_09700 [SAR324 cluster bacterium]
MLDSITGSISAEKKMSCFIKSYKKASKNRKESIFEGIYIAVGLVSIRLKAYRITLKKSKPNSRK